MASSLRRKNLVCFYCNKRSDIKYDGFITQWECAKCESVNFLDEHGEVTDPPVATEIAAPVNLKYAIPRSESPSSQESDSSLFCSTCLKNQHLYTASLSQYDIETDPTHPQYRDLERKYFVYRKSLERRYPQVCEDCEPRVLERMREAGRTAKADHLRRLMDRSRARKSVVVNTLSLSSFIDLAGKLLWYTGLLGEIVWNVMSLVATAKHGHYRAFEGFLQPSLKVLLDFTIHISTSRAWAWSSLFCTVASLWWNPMFKQMNSGFMNHIKGFREWYKLQFLLVVTRSLFYYIMGTGALMDPFSAASTGAHIFFPCFVALLAFVAIRSLRIDMSPLWTSTPEKLSHVGPRSRSPDHGVNSMADALDQIAASPSRRSRQLSLSSPPAYGLQVQPKGIQSKPLSSIQPAIPRNLLPATGEVTVRLQPRDHVAEVEEMEWSPSQGQSQHRAFNDPRSLQRQTQLFGEAPTGDLPSPFWYRVPPAPITPAQRLRNPPNQPRLRVASQETKENFFNNITRRSSGVDVAEDERVPALRNESSRQEIEFAQQKFFPPPPPSETGNALADLLTAFSLGNSETEPSRPVEASSTTRHICQSTALFLGLFFWNYTFLNPTEHSRNVMMTVMITCALIGFRTMLDNTILKRAGNKMTAVQGIGACLGGLEAGAAVYGTLQVLARYGECENCISLGTMLTGGMLVHEVWLALWGH